MKLTYAPASPFVRKVRVMLAETNQTDEVELLRVHTTPMATAAEVAAANPVGKIPALIRSDAPAIYDSRVICQYLSDRAGGGMYPDREKWEVMTLEATGDAIAEAVLQIVYEKRFRPAQMQDSDWLEAQWAKAERAVKAVNDRWMGHLNGPVTAGHIAIACALGYIDFRLPDSNWRKGNDGLDDWFAVFSQRDSMKSTEPHD